MALAVTAIRAAENRVSAAATKILRTATVQVSPSGHSQSPGERPGRPALPAAQLFEALSDLKQAELGFREAIVAIRAADRVTRRTLDILT